ncbi:hypothetical protein [Streptomyces sp. NBC_01443]|uniref:hypothetical protein n=1 Tax=Streptomyces sp. NBC_01443 TaxID=2903868 RepID=UPI00225768F0|nr:hypothetical protein [Streptomyces sp. NBC_01443]MCX4632115.1 hypothetical protein [Streptomyces sp. NBC_01443]
MAPDGPELAKKEQPSKWNLFRQCPQIGISLMGDARHGYRDPGIGTRRPGRRDEDAPPGLLSGTPAGLAERDALPLAHIMRTDLPLHRSLPDDSELTRAIAVLARAGRTRSVQPPAANVPENPRIRVRRRRG